MNTTATQQSSESEINQLNLAMRQTPWYQEFFKRQGLDPNKVKLSDAQRTQLTQLAAQNGYQLGGRMKIDQAGNINQMGGFAGMPTWAKIAIAAAPIAATAGFGAAGMGPMAGMFGTSTGAATGAATGELGAMAGTGAYAVPTVAATSTGLGGMTIPTVAGLTGAAKKGGDLIASMVDQNKPDYAQTFADIGSLFGNVAESEAANRNNKADIAREQGYLNIAAQNSQREGESDALKKIQQAGYIKSGGTPYDASKVQLANGRSLPSFNLPRAPITDQAKQAAGDLETEMQKRLKPGGQYTPPDLESLTNRGKLESATNTGSLITGGLGAINKFGFGDDLMAGAKKAGKTLWDWFS